MSETSSQRRNLIDVDKQIYLAACKHTEYVDLEELLLSCTKLNIKRCKQPLFYHR